LEYQEEKNSYITRMIGQKCYLHCLNHMIRDKSKNFAFISSVTAIWDHSDIWNTSR
jgi:hypothetical protein